MNGWHVELLYGSDGWYMVCDKCGARLLPGVEAYVKDDKEGNGEIARCLTHENEAYGVECDCGWCGIVDVVDDLWLCPNCGYVQEIVEVEPDPDEYYVWKKENHEAEA